ncbi:DUF167 domain-containing protein [Legionella sp. km772]|uniref:DUF167 domain-containing protein n=1 Tax=Legionella sp. km772 TaxID=2498111 RepID=UPI000F8CB765|nr:DUF167 domain-containing protein [Legionella sp. km772]RUR12939.1 YggU family protein [Legionella sp. km772]
MWYQYNENELIIKVYVQAGAKSTELQGFYADALKIRLNAPAIEGRANEALIKFLAHLFDVPTREVTLVRGKQSKHKTLVITGTKICPDHLLD